jgi:hypothetical protein
MGDSSEAHSSAEADELSHGTFIAESPKRLRKKYLPRGRLTSAAKADAEKKPPMAAVNRCATQNPPKIKGNVEFVRKLLAIFRIEV